MEKNYESYQLSDFLEDSFFIEWIKEETPEAVQFWDAWSAKHPVNIETFREAELQLRAFLSVKRIVPEAGDAAEVWQRIDRATRTTGRRVWMNRVKYAAAVAILIIGSYFIWHQFAKKTDEPVLAKKELEKDVAPGGNKAILTLADGTKVILDSANNGAITRQGNVTIIKLNDGQLAYQPSTSSTIPTILYNTISTPRGGQYQVVLADGSKVWLNAASSIKFPNAFPGKDRKVEITGEAYFEVAHNAAKPFYVDAAEMEVKVLGTHFNVNAYADEGSIKTTLLQGSVRVSEGEKSVVIKPGEQAQLQTVSHELRTKGNVNLEKIMAWKNGFFSFDDANIKTIMKELARWYNIDVIYEGEVPPVQFSGAIGRDLTLNQVMSVLDETRIHYELIGRKLIIKN